MSEAESPGNELAITKFTMQVFDSPSLGDHLLHFVVNVGLQSGLQQFWEKLFT